MSIHVMNAVWNNAPYQGNTLLTLLALANWSNDEGESWPSMVTLAKKSRQSERNCQSVIKTLKDDGFLSIEERPGTSNMFRINLLSLEGCKDCTPAKTSKRGGFRGAKTAPPPPAKTAPYTSVDTSVIKDTSAVVFTLTSPETEKKAFEIPEWLPLKEWDEWKEDRKERKIPPTPGAQRIAIRKLAELRTAGEDPAEILREAVIRGWRGIFSIKSKFQDRPKPPEAGEEEDALAEQKRREQSRKKAVSSGQ